MSSALFAPARSAARALAQSLPAYLQLTKLRLSGLVAVTAATGFLLGLDRGPMWPRLVWTTLGTLLVACGANTLNQWCEAARDARMRRTAARPLPTGRLSPRSALVFGTLTGVLGSAMLALLVNVAAAGTALAALLIYVLLYTPLKVRTPLNTLVGAVVGALGPAVGWLAATGRFDDGAWILSAILLVWQIPHFLALAWLYRDDYQQAGFRMLAQVDPTGQLTGCLVVIYALALVPLTILPTLIGVTGWSYAAGALVLGTGLVLASAALERRRSSSAARGLFLASVVYLPLLLGLMVFDRVN